MELHPVVAVYFDPPGKMDYPFSKQNYYESYSLFSELCASQGVKVYIVRGNTYKGNMVFSGGWEFSGMDLLDVNREIHCDVVYDKDFGHVFSCQSGSCDNVVNPLEFDDLARNKWKCYQMFSRFMAPTYQITKDSWLETLDTISTDIAVLKPEVGFAGRGVIVKKKVDLHPEDIEGDEPYIVQEFLDSSAGIEGLISGLHDLRVFVFNGVPKLSYIRTPKEGSYVANLAQGGTIKPIRLEDVPESAMDIVRAVDAEYRIIYPRIYTVDLMFADGRPYLIETNIRPGFQNPKLVGEEFARTFHQSVLDTLLSSLEKRN